MSERAVCFYVSGHGLGHASRAAQVMRCLPPEVPLIVKSTAPEAFFRREAARPLEYVSERFDAGCWQASNVKIDWERTFREAIAVQQAATARLHEEAAFLRERRVGVVVSDVPAPPLLAAALAGLPGVAVVNFTWVEIYRAAARRRADVRELLRGYRAQYRTATLALRTPLSFPMSWFPEIRDIPLIARTGIRRRRTLEEALGIGSGRRIALLYFGAWGSSEMALERLSAMADVTFVAFTPMPEPVHCLDPEVWHFPDVVASVDVVLAKPGYGTIGECMANGTPVVYYPRTEFAEYPKLRQGLEQWGGAVRISRSDFLACRWEAALERTAGLRPARVPADGAAVAAREILALIR